MIPTISVFGRDNFPTDYDVVMVNLTIVPMEITIYLVYKPFTLPWESGDVQEKQASNLEQSYKTLLEFW